VPVSSKVLTPSTFFGERFDSFLPLIRRAFPWRGLVTDHSVSLPDPAYTSMSYMLPAFPVPFASVNGWDTTLAADPYSFTNTGWMAYLAPSFLGFRGSLTWYIADTTPNLENNQGVPVRYTYAGFLNGDPGGIAPQVNPWIKTDLSAAQAARDAMSPPGGQSYYMLNGTLTATSAQHGVTTVSTPPYNPALYRICATDPLNTVGFSDECPNVSIVTSMHPNVVLGNAECSRLMHFVSVAASDNFEFIYYKYPPRVYRCTTVPAAST